MPRNHIVALACKTPETTVLLGDTEMATEGSRNADFVKTFLLRLDSNARTLPLFFAQNAKWKVTRSVSMKKKSQVLLTATNNTSTHYAFMSTGSRVLTSIVFTAIEHWPYRQSRHLVIQSVPAHVHLASRYYCRSVSSMASTIINPSAPTHELWPWPASTSTIT